MTAIYAAEVGGSESEGEPAWLQEAVTILARGAGAVTTSS